MDNLSIVLANINFLKGKKSFPHFLENLLSNQDSEELLYLMHISKYLEINLKEELLNLIKFNVELEDIIININTDEQSIRD